MPHRKQLVWSAIIYIALLALVLYPAVHEGFGVKVILWDSVPPTLGLIAIISALGKSTRRLFTSATFAFFTAAATALLFSAWFFTPLDTDPHSVMTVFVFVLAPVLSLAVATVASAVAWFLVRVP
jgi:hypothetical protein